MGYLEVVPKRLQGPSWQYDPDRLIEEYQLCIKQGRDIPPWMFANTAQGRRNFDTIFVYCVTRFWKIELDRVRSKVDPRLKLRNQKALFLGQIPCGWVLEAFGKESKAWQAFFINPEEEYLTFKPEIGEGGIKAAGFGDEPERKLLSLLQYSKDIACGSANWDTFVLKHKLWTGMRTHYGGSVMEAFLFNFPWAFHRASVKGDLHYSDFKNFLAADASPRAKLLTDHLLREDYRLVKQEGNFTVIDPRLLPDASTPLAKELGFANYTDFIRSTGIHSIIMQVPEAGGSFGGLLFWCFPGGFDPHNPRHIHLWDFLKVGEGRFPSLVEKANALMHVAEELRIRIGQIYWRMTPEVLTEQKIPDLLDSGQAVCDVFAQYFADQIRTGAVIPEARIDYTGGQSRFQLLGGGTFSFSTDLTDCFARQDSKEHLTIYKKPEQVSGGAIVRIRKDAGGSVVSRTREPFPAYAVYFSDPTTLRPYDAAVFPEMTAFGSLSKELSDWGFSPLWLALTEQRQALNLYRAEKFAKVQWYLKNRGITDREGFRPGN
jgi:hypothetical protein